jgi:cellulose synthase/poly-beta-1,6-N-acetylglucosamine synthase-like glycosyltransferase
MEINFLIYIICFFLLLNLSLILKIIYQNYKLKKSNRLSPADSLLSIIYNNEDLPKLSFSKRILLLENFAQSKTLFNFDDVSKEKLTNYIYSDKLVKSLIKKLSSPFKYNRIKSALYLSHVKHREIISVLEHTLSKEKNYIVKLYLVYALTTINNSSSIQVIVHTLIGAPHWYRKKINVLICEYKSSFLKFLPAILYREEIEIKELILDFAYYYPDANLKKFVVDFIDSNQFDPKYRHLVKNALNVLEHRYFEELDSATYLESSNPQLQISAIKALGKINSLGSIDKLLTKLSNPELSPYSEASLLMLIQENPSFISILFEHFNNTNDNDIKNGLAEVLANKIEYILLKLLYSNKLKIISILKQIILKGKNSAIISFLNNNANIELENEILSLLMEIFKDHEDIKKDYSTYLNERLLEKCSLTKYDINKSKSSAKRMFHPIQILYLFLVLSLGFFPLVYILTHFNILKTTPIINHIVMFISQFNYYLIFYSISINSVYLILLILSFWGIKTQYKYWKIKSRHFLFKKRMLPTISIIAPAFNEGNTIIDNVNSLLNLAYPNYEIIIVNDGSLDDTLIKLINYFHLDKTDFVYSQNIPTSEVLGIYKNKNLPNLLVVNKVNSGKADSLNVGLNISSKEFYCAIDSDSIIETESLLKLASLTIDSEKETVALGGNILPINGCQLSHGFISKFGLSNNSVVRLQTVEYIRAFMAGRVGWSKLNSLLIISGAFGIFDKEKIISIGGYLTSKNKFEKDTFGEDMELVVRLSKELAQNNTSYKINYSFNANCWTQVPETLPVLHRQRNRWHRGLLEIMTYHKNMILNPKYTNVGLLGFPYFLIFEVLGPIIEVQGYVMVIISLLLGLLNIELGLLLFISIILYGTTISLYALSLTQANFQYFTLKETLTMVAYSIIENFGFKQLGSIWRFGAFFSSFHKPQEWGNMERRSF